MQKMQTYRRIYAVNGSEVSNAGTIEVGEVSLRNSRNGIETSTVKQNNSSRAEYGDDAIDKEKT